MHDVNHERAQWQYYGNADDESEYEKSRKFYISSGSVRNE